MNEILQAIEPHLPLAATWVGIIIGWIKNRVLRGLLLGATLGPLGWIVVAVGQGRFRECPSCSKPMRAQRVACPHCGANVDRVQSRSARSNLKGAMGSKGPW